MGCRNISLEVETIKLLYKKWFYKNTTFGI